MLVLPSTKAARGHQPAWTRAADPGDMTSVVGAGGNAQAQDFSFKAQLG